MKRAIILICFVLILSISGCIEKPIGGERDEHGCLGSAGYSWNETDQACVREWEKGKINNFEECIDAGYPAMESYPRQCMDGTGQAFTEQIDISSEEECAEQGGNWTLWTHMVYVCIVPYSDGGNTCTDSSDCLGELCVYHGDEPAGSTASGECAESNAVSCVSNHYFIKDNKVIEEICVD